MSTIQITLLLLQKETPCSETLSGSYHSFRETTAFMNKRNNNYAFDFTITLEYSLDNNTTGCSRDYYFHSK